MQVRQGRGPVHLPAFVSYLGDRLTSTVVAWDFDGIGKMQEYRLAEVIRYELPVAKFSDQQVENIAVRARCERRDRECVREMRRWWLVDACWLAPLLGGQDELSTYVPADPNLEIDLHEVILVLKAVARYG